MMEAQLRRLGPVSRVKVLKTPKDCRTKIWLAGRGTSCQIYTKSKYASRQHFSITYREQKYFISDLQSANGTFLNDEKLLSEKALSFGSVISVGVPSDMQNSPDCIVYVFESCSDVTPAENEMETVPEVTRNAEPQPAPRIEEVENMEIDPKPKRVKKGKTTEDRVSLNVEKTTGDRVSPELDKTIENRMNPKLENRVSPDVEITVETMVNPKLENRVSPEVEKTIENRVNPKLENRVVSPEVEKTLNDSSSSDVVFIEPMSPPGKHKKDVSESQPVKKRKLEKNSVEVIQKIEQNRTNPTGTEAEVEEEDIFAYEALTQVDEAQVKPEPDILNYSQSEEMIEISDSEDDLCPGLKQEGGSKSPEGGDEDDDVVFLETIVREPRKTELPPVRCKVEDDLTETDKRWMGKLFKMEAEMERLPGKESSTEVEKGGEDQEPEEMEVEEDVESPTGNGGNVVPCSVEMSKLSVEDVQKENAEPPPDMFPRVEVPKKILKNVVPVKSVSFNMVPQIRYFEVPTKTRLTANEVGRMRFTRVIFNICNWNTHWLEECKRVAPGKDPPDICEERLRKIPKKFPSHSDYMKAFIPAMLLHLWNKVKDKWVASGETGFRQTVSCDSCEDYHTENLSVYKCTGLVQSVDAHKQFLREGHLVLLRLHQVQLPQFTTPASEKYSKKLGYLVFGFVESKTYERFHSQRLHQSLAERCASIVGDLHIVRLNILVKKRPSFQIDKKKLIQLTVVQQICQEIRLFRGICFLPDSPLCCDILKPPKIETHLEPPKYNLVFKGPLDEFQSQVVRKLSHECSSTSSILRSVIGAGGTGKGQIVMGLILQLLYGEEWKCRRPKIIYCTQWSIPLDEMVLKLKSCRQTVGGEPFSLVRVGPIREVRPEVRDLCVSNLANSRRNPNKRELDGRKFDAEIDVIRDADVICTTCISAGVSKMCSAFEKLLIRDRDRKVICIIDEAMSCREPESVVPLLLGVTHLILVGDIYQFEPTFSGEKTYSLGLDMSLFWRIYKNFVNIPDKQSWPITILKTQYRMYSSLSKFTGQLIYSTRLQKPVTEATPNRIANIRSHLLMVDPAPDVGAVEKEIREVRIISQMTKAVTKMAKVGSKNPVRFAIITCDTRLNESLQAVLPKGEFPELEIDKIQAFQGREFDLVTFVYDGRKIPLSWLATALTRARNSLFIFGTEQAIKGNSFFKKMLENAVKYGFLEHVHPEMSIAEFEEIVRAV